MTRLIWNFDLSPLINISFNQDISKKEDGLKWEARFFWPEHEMIQLNTITPDLLDLSHYQKKEKQDLYYLIPKYNYNIKRRHNKLHYKPLIRQSAYALGFGKKINLGHLDKNEPNKAFLEKIRHKVLAKGVELLVQKELLTYKFKTIPVIKLELSRIIVQKNIYFSACIEGKSFHLVDTISTILLGKRRPCDYITFLKQITSS